MRGIFEFGRRISTKNSTKRACNRATLVLLTLSVYFCQIMLTLLFYSTVRRVSTTTRKERKKEYNSSCN